MEDSSPLDSPVSSPCSSSGPEHASTSKATKVTDPEETKAASQRWGPAAKKRFPGRWANRAAWHPRSGNLLQKIRDRETRIGQGQDKMFKRLPIRLIFCLKDTVPISALEAGHIFLGFSKCGQFLLSYTQTTADIELMGDIHINYHYRLHWWSFIPYKRAKKMAEVMLFSNQGAPGNLHLSVCQWPSDAKKIVVFAYSLGNDDCEDLEAENPASSKACFLTVTAVPSLRGCKDCVRVATSYEEEDLAAAWNSCARLSCLEHGMTIHTSFDLVQPYPKFEPKISLKRDNYILINTGNLLHSLHIQLERLDNSTEEPPQPKPAHHRTSPPQKTKWSELHIGTTELTISGGGVFSPPLMCSPSNPHPGAASDSENTDYESDSGTNAKYVIHNQDRLAKVAEFAERCSLPRPARQFIRGKGSLFHQISSLEDHGSSSRKRMAEKAYEITDDDFDEGVREQFNTFRKKRLAEKKYEFKDEDSENVTPLRRLRSQTRASQDQASQPGSSPAHPDESVLRPLDSNQSSTGPASGQESSTTSSICVSTEHGHTDDEVPGLLMVNTMPVPELLSPGSMVKKDQSQQHSVMLSPRAASDQDPPRFHAKFTRRFIELDDEMISVITDIEDDELGASTATTISYHLVLPLEVHGSGYQSMAMISNSKAGKISGRCLKIQQRSLDLEMFCHFMAQKLCLAANRKYWYCNDYDVEIIDLDSESGDVICVAVVLVKATTVTKKVSQHQKYSISSFHRHQYQATFKFTWNIFTAECTVIDSERLTEIDGYNIYSHELQQSSGGSVWHPAKNISSALQKHWSVLSSSNVKCFTNDAVIRGTSLETIVDPEHLVAIIQDNLS
eukprot:maker-scaffold106_size358372-snap-gene-2.37 protein:Tk03546 transcript:maker-scaffold106_size358372-snap-gene-2.37-mRNA-1 annotation:"PREDICTED: uncharacterized protein LOC100570502 isoform X2"